MTETDALLEGIDDVFPPMAMPAADELTFHNTNCYLCAEIQRYLNASRDIGVDDALISFLHQELYHLSPIAFRWILPHYLRFCLSFGGKYSQEEIYFLVFNLSPAPKFRDETYERLSALNVAQVNFLIHFLKWCYGNEDWVEISEDVDKAVEFLRARP